MDQRQADQDRTMEAMRQLEEASGFADDDTVVGYAELNSRADTRVTYKYEFRPADTRRDRR